MADMSPLVLSLSALASSLSIASSTKNLMKVDNLSPEDALEKLRQIAPPDLQIALSDPLLVSSSTEVLIIEEGLLEQLTHEAVVARDNHIKSRKDAEALPRNQRRQAVSKADDDAVDDICQILRAIKRFNGELPEQGQYRRWWQSYSCID